MAALAGVLNRNERSDRKQRKNKVKRGGKNRKETVLCMMSANAAQLKGKLNSFKNELKLSNSAIFTLQECHYATKGKVQIQDFEVFEATGWFFETDIFKFVISQNVKAYERSNYMENSPNRFPFWYLVSQKFHNFLVINHLWRLLRQVIERM